MSWSKRQFLVPSLLPFLFEWGLPTYPENVQRTVNRLGPKTGVFSEAKSGRECQGVAALKDHIWEGNVFLKKLGLQGLGRGSSHFKREQAGHMRFEWVVAKEYVRKEERSGHFCHRLRDLKPLKLVWLANWVKSVSAMLAFRASTSQKSPFQFISFSQVPRFLLALTDFGNDRKSPQLLGTARVLLTAQRQMSGSRGSSCSYASVACKGQAQLAGAWGWDELFAWSPSAARSLLKAPSQAGRGWVHSGNLGVGWCLDVDGWWGFCTIYSTRLWKDLFSLRKNKDGVSGSLTCGPSDCFSLFDFLHWRLIKAPPRPIVVLSSKWQEFLGGWGGWGKR